MWKLKNATNLEGKKPLISRVKGFPNPSQKCEKFPQDPSTHQNPLEPLQPLRSKIW